MQLLKCFSINSFETVKNTRTLTLLHVYIGMRLNVRASITKTVEDLRKFHAIKKPKFVNF